MKAIVKPQSCKPSPKKDGLYPEGVLYTSEMMELSGQTLDVFPLKRDGFFVPRWYRSKGEMQWTWHESWLEFIDGMKFEDVRIGMKVVPHSKSAWCAFADSPVIREMKAAGQEFLFVTKIYDDKEIALSISMKDPADLFLAEDFTPYVEKETKTMTTKTLKAVVKDLSCVADPHNLDINDAMKDLVGKTIEVLPVKGRKGVYHDTNRFSYFWDENWLDFYKDSEPTTKTLKAKVIVPIPICDPHKIGYMESMKDMEGKIIEVTEHYYDYRKSYYGAGWSWDPSWLDFDYDKCETKPVKTPEKLCVGDHVICITDDDPAKVGDKAIVTNTSYSRVMVVKFDGRDNVNMWKDRWQKIKEEDCVEEDVEEFVKFHIGDRIVCIEHDMPVDPGATGTVVSLDDDKGFNILLGSEYCNPTDNGHWWMQYDHWKLQGCETKKSVKTVQGTRHNHYLEDFEIEINKNAGTVTVNYGDGERFTSICQKGDKFDARVGLALSLMKAEHEPDEINNALENAKEVC